VEKKGILHTSYVQDSILDVADYNSSSFVRRRSDIVCFFPSTRNWFTTDISIVISENLWQISQISVVA